MTWPDSRPADWSPEWMPAPRWGTPRRPDRQSHGPLVAMIADRLGTPLLPWQRHVVDVGMEVDPATGLMCYGTVVVTVARQSGKTQGVTFPRQVARAMGWRGQRLVYTAQDRNSARAKFEEDFVERLRAAPGFREGRDYSVRLANGSERIRFRNGSIIGISATMASSGHGKTLDDAAVDEAWEHRTTDVDQGFRVPMITRRRVQPGAQMWIVSTQGDERSVYLTEKCDLGRAAVERGDDRGVAYFEWSLADDCDPYDRSAWWHAMPGLGHLVTEDDIAGELAAMGLSDWLRAYGNIPQKGTAEPDPIDRAAWAAARGRSGPTGMLVYGVAVSVDRSRASLGVAGERDGGGLVVEVIDTQPGTRWVADRVAEVWARNGGEGVAVDPGSPAGSLISELEARDVPVIRMNAREHAQACGALVDRVPSGELSHLGQPGLDAAVAGARRRPLSDAWAWDRKAPDVDVTPLEAVTLALGALLGKVELSVYADRGFFDWDAA